MSDANKSAASVLIFSLQQQSQVEHGVDVVGRDATALHGSSGWQGGAGNRSASILRCGGKPAGSEVAASSDPSGGLWYTRNHIADVALATAERQKSVERLVLSNGT